MHTPLLQTSPAPQTVPHAPQLRLSALVSLHASPHFVSEPHVVVQTPPLQTLPVPHAFPQPPQFATSTLVSLHVPLQLVSDPQVSSQVPELQTLPLAHVVPHVPHAPRSYRRSRHTAPHSVRPAAQVAAQRPPEHTSPDGQDDPQNPQLALSFARS